VYPAATALTDELDWAAITKAGSKGRLIDYPAGHYILNRPITVSKSRPQEHFGHGESTWLENVVAQPDSPQASVFELGNIHPVIMNTSLVDQAWQVVDLAPVTRGDTSVKVLQPSGVTRLGAGDVVVIRSDNGPVYFGASGVAAQYDLEQWNRVVAWNARTGALELELPVPASIGASPSRDVLGGPKLCVNAGFDPFRRSDWWVAKDITIRDMKLTGQSPAGVRTGAWRCTLKNLTLDCEHLLSANALTLCKVHNLKGHWSKRMLEVKQVCQDTTFSSIHGTFRQEPGVTPATPISIGEQSSGLTFTDIRCQVGPAFLGNLRTLEIAARDIEYTGAIHDLRAVRNAETWAVKSSNNYAMPPSNIQLDLSVRVRDGTAPYGVVGSDANLDGIDDDANPSRVRLTLDQRCFGPEKPQWDVRLVRGTEVDVASSQGDALNFLSGTTQS
jgi:hypothetical protein